MIMTEQEIKVVYVNGQFVPKSEARVSCFDEGVTHGWAIYEGIRVYDGKILHLDAHIDRLYDSAKGAFIKIPLTKDEFKKAVLDTVKANGFRNCHIMPWVSYGERGGKPTIVIPARPAKSDIGKEVKAVVSAIRRASCDSIDPKIKTNSRLDLCLASLEARRAGVDYAIMLDKDGLVAEVSMANIFVVKKGAVYTPTLVHALDGITREVLMKMYKSSGIPMEERNLTIQDLYSADEVFLCGSGAEIHGIIEIDQRVIGEGRTGPLTRKAVDWYVNHIREDGVPIY
jgi:branched-chain amino acid aminotransferase